MNIKSNASDEVGVVRRRSHKGATMKIAIWVVLEVPRNLNYTGYLYLKEIKFCRDLISRD